MSLADARGCRLSGATPAALEAYERALSAFSSWHDGAETLLRPALQEAPGFVMALVLQACLLLGSRDPRRVQSARPLLARAAALPANDAERLHLAAAAAVLADDYEGAKARLGELLRRQPRDLLALQMAHAYDYATGDLARLRDRVALVLPAWSRELPGYHAVLAMHAFSLEESGDFARAEQAAREALALDAFDARAHHAMAHVFEMTGRAEAGIRWMNDHVACWGVGTLVAAHCGWHLALFHLTAGETDRALALYDRGLRAHRASELAELIDAAALLWRLELAGVEAGARWGELADAWAPHIDDGFCSFNDLHAMLAFVGAGNDERARRLERSLLRAGALPTRHGETTHRIGLPACRALIAFGHGDHAQAASLLAKLPALAHRLGGSHAQRDVLHLTQRYAMERMRRPRPARAGAEGCTPICKPLVV